jgi:septation ring formation regulator EzrA
MESKDNIGLIELLIAAGGLLLAGTGAWGTSIWRQATTNEKVKQLENSFIEIKATINELKQRDSLLTDTSHRIEERLTTIESEIKNLTEMVKGNLSLRDVVIRLDEQIKNFTKK